MASSASPPTSTAPAGGETAQLPATPTARVLIAGHVDSAAAGAGAFFPLPKRPPERSSPSPPPRARTVRYKVTRVQQVLKAKLPSDVFDSSGPARLALVTCGGPFDSQTGHYRDNIIVWATPV